jgi:hypothetical protein
MKELFPEKTLSREVGRMIGKELMGGREINLDVVAKNLAWIQVVSATLNIWFKG